MNWDTVFKTGTHTDSKGVTRNWTSRELDQLVKNTDQDVPIVIHHPEDQDKAMNFGKVALFRFKDGKIEAQYKAVPQILKLAVKEGLKLAKSVSIDPVKMQIRHIGLLGAGQPPAVDGLGAVSFSADDEGDPILTYLFNRNTDKKEGQLDPKDTKIKDQKIKDLEEQIKTLEAGKETETLKTDLEHAITALKAEQDAHKETKKEFSKYKAQQADKDLSARVDALAESGRIKPAEKDKVLGFGKAMDTDNATMEFSAPDGTKEKVPPRENYLRDLEARPENKDGLLTEFARREGADQDYGAVEDFSDINSFA